ncbi:hypothetical protein Acsp07_30520 [Actinomycetospora sp. NBRC 106378]|uniref:hypothetical protein n=1 Tax=Actinomycetospora sp. CA-084318 TaxID=3239892 RepID=UPI0024A56B0B|nr:hypothetical protein Acsp07_30520 [Actinomycetospora sp. NBRC 106378]
MLTSPTFYITYRIVPVVLGLLLAGLVMWRGWRAMLRDDRDTGSVVLGWLVLGGTAGLALWGIWIGITSPVRFF